MNQRTCRIYLWGHDCNSSLRSDKRFWATLFVVLLNKNGQSVIVLRTTRRIFAQTSSQPFQKVRKNHLDTRWEGDSLQITFRKSTRRQRTSSTRRHIVVCSCIALNPTRFYWTTINESLISFQKSQESSSIRTSFKFRNALIFYGLSVHTLNVEDE